MTRSERLAMIETLRAANDLSAIEIEQRRRQRELDGSDWDDPIIVKVAAADQILRRTEPQLKYSQPYHNNDHDQPSSTMQDTLEELADVIGEETGKSAAEIVKLKAAINSLSDEVSTLRTQMVIMRATMSGEIKLIEGSRNVA